MQSLMFYVHNCYKLAANLQRNAPYSPAMRMPSRLHMTQSLQSVLLLLGDLEGLGVWLLQDERVLIVHRKQLLMASPLKPCAVV